MAGDSPAKNLLERYTGRDGGDLTKSKDGAVSSSAILAPDFLHPDIANPPTTATTQKLTGTSASLLAAVPPTTSKSAVQTHPCDVSVMTAADIPQKATCNQVATMADPTEPGNASEDMSPPKTHNQTQNNDFEYKYQYSPLPGSWSIRLLRLMPNEDENARIECQLFDYPLHNSSEGTHLYEALSYVWGNTDDHQSISINQRDLNVTSNLHAALVHLRSRLLERLLWVDAICINQEDPNEKGQQVQSMANIYIKANRVIVWLGEAAADSDRAIEDIRNAAVDQSSKYLINKTSEQAILMLLQRPWYQRIWVLQEVAAARYVLVKCGRTEIDGYAFCSATERRDKVYALLGMCSDDLSGSNLLVDYKIPWGQLFQQLVNFFISEQVSVRTWNHKEIAVMEGKGCILGEVSSVERDTAWEDKQHVGITWKMVPSHFGLEGAWSSRLTLQTSAKSVQVGDALCLLQGASKPTIIRLYNDYWAVIIIAAPPTDDVGDKAGDIKWSKLLQLVTVFPHGFLLVWDWDIHPDNPQKGEDYDYFMSNRVPKCPKTELEDCLDKAARLQDVRLVLQEMERYEVAVKNLQKAIEIFERALRSMDDLELTRQGYSHWGEGDLRKLEALIDLVIKEKGQWTLLCLAAGKGHEAVVKLLLDTGKVEPNAEDLQTALWLAERNEHGKVVERLLGSLENGHEAVLTLLLDGSKIGLNVQDTNNDTKSRKFLPDESAMLDYTQTDTELPARSTTKAAKKNQTGKPRRHKKCDEGRPSCQACVDMGLACDGYWVLGDLPTPSKDDAKAASKAEAVVTRAVTSTSPRIPPMPSYDSVFFADQQDFDYFNAFVFAARQDGSLPISDLVQMTPQIARDTAHIRDLCTAAGATIMRMSLSYCTHESGKVALQDATRRTIMHTSRAIQVLCKVKPTAANLRMTVLASLMMCTSGIIRETDKAALAHFTHARLVLDQYIRVRCKETNTAFEKLRLDLVDEAIYDVVQNLSTYSWDFEFSSPMPDRSRPGTLPEPCMRGWKHAYRVKDMPSRFVYDKEAARWWNCLQHFIMHHLDDGESSDISQGTDQILLSALPPKDDTLLERRLSKALAVVTRWHGAFQPLFDAGAPAKLTQPERYSQLVTLELLYQETLARLYAHRGQDTVPSRSPLYREILRASQLLIGRTKPLNQSMSTPYIDNAAINPLAFVLNQCRDPAVLDELKAMLLPRAGMDSPTMTMLGLLTCTGEVPSALALGWKSWAFYLTSAGCRVGELDLLK
ncbi:hypothetical protein S40293_04426 [Stachybotrys chartarum IBT 40293]|nr:hypothetical protein S40293_04426 [Stachybotrys chartarum IBT 40293]